MVHLYHTLTPNLQTKYFLLHIMFYFFKPCSSLVPTMWVISGLTIQNIPTKPYPPTHITILIPHFHSSMHVLSFSSLLIFSDVAWQQI